jgi:hypothetical protein
LSHLPEQLSRLKTWLSHCCRDELPYGTLPQQLSYWTNFDLLCHSASLAIPWLPSSLPPSSPDVPG